MITESAADIASVDWKIIAGFIGTVLGSAFIAWSGAKKGKKIVEEGKSEITPILGGMIMETASMTNLTIAIQHHTHSVKENSEELRIHTEVIRQHMLELVRSK